METAEEAQRNGRGNYRAAKQNRAGISQCRKFRTNALRVTAWFGLKHRDVLLDEQLDSPVLPTSSDIDAFI